MDDDNPCQIILTVGELKRILGPYSDDTRILFNASLSDRGPTELCFHRPKDRGPKLLQIQLSEPATQR